MSADDDDHGAAPRLDTRDLRRLALVGLGVVLLLPWIAAWREPFAPGPEYRVPHALAEDTWLAERWIETASSSESTALVLGDSVVWGEFAAPSETLSAALSRASGTSCANLGLPGLHPLALEGLVAYHAGELRDRVVLLVVNLLWTSSPERDLSAEMPSTFNHASLVPQLWPHVPAYGADLSERIGCALERRVELFSWVRHARLTRFDGLDPPRWSVEHPGESVRERLRGDPAVSVQPADAPRQPAVPWTETRARPEDLAWISLDDSLQWAATRRTARQMRDRGARLLVVLWPLNEALLEDTSRERFNARRLDAAARLSDDGLTVLAPAAPASESWADLSHPLAAGYEELAEEILRVDRESATPLFGSRTRAPSVEGER